MAPSRPAPRRRRRASDRVAWKRVGLRRTPQREVVLDLVFGCREHPTADWIWREAQRTIPDISLATVYRTLRVLKEKGLRASLEQTGLEILAIAVKEPYSLGTDDPDMMNVIEISPPWDPIAIESPDKSKGPDLQIKPIPDESGSQIAFKLPKLEKGNVELVISNMQGRRIWTYSGSGVDAVIWKGEDLKGNHVSKGTYIYKITVGSFKESGRVQIRR